MSSEKLGDKIYDLRMSNKLSQDELADKIKVSRQTISKWEANAYQPKANMLMRLCDAFNVDSTYFMPKRVAKAETKDKSENPESEVVCDEVMSDETNEINLDKVEDFEIQQEPKRRRRKLSKRAKIVITAVVLAISIAILIIGIIFLVYDVATMAPNSNGSFGDVSTNVTMNFSLENIGWILFSLAIAIAAILGIILICKRFKDKKNKNEEVTESHKN